MAVCSSEAKGLSQLSVYSSQYGCGYRAVSMDSGVEVCLIGGEDYEYNYTNQ